MIIARYDVILHQSVRTLLYNHLSNCIKINALFYGVISCPFFVWLKILVQKKSRVKMELNARIQMMGTSASVKLDSREKIVKVV